MSDGQITFFTSDSAGEGDGGSDGAEAARDAPPGASPETALPVARLNERARLLLEESFGPLWVLGEIANWRRVASGHCYFTLRDATAQIDCVLFRSDARRLPTEPDEGMEVSALGRVTLYEARGRYQLVVRRLEAKGEGLWRLAFERLYRKLEAEGLMDPARKRPLPRFPRRVGVVTSRTGAAVRDVISVVRRRAPWVDLLICPCRVQGDGAAREIRSALDRLASSTAGVDVVILTRGGGSVEDLWCFNDEDLARRVARMPMPIISAVGHEIDVTIVDLVADVRAATPSAAAELAVPDGAELVRQLEEQGSRIEEAVRLRVRRARERCDRLEERFLSAWDRRTEKWRTRVVRASDRLHALSPLATLRRGYAVPLGDRGEVLRRVAMFRTGDPFRLRVVDGVVDCRTEGRRPLDPEEGAAGTGNRLGA